MASQLLLHPLCVKPPHKSLQLHSLPSIPCTLGNMQFHGRVRRCVSVVVPAAYKVTIEHNGTATVVEVEEDETILDRALEEGVEVPHKCRLGVCLTCPARLVSGEVDQSEGVLGEEVVEKGYTQLCATYPRSDCHIKTIPEEELLSLGLMSME